MNTRELEKLRREDREESR